MDSSSPLTPIAEWIPIFRLECERAGFEKGISTGKRNLNAKEYKNIDEEYGRQLIRVVTTEQSKKDLSNYHTVTFNMLLWRGFHLCQYHNVTFET
jgi:hypothetical protein